MKGQYHLTALACAIAVIFGYVANLRAQSVPNPQLSLTPGVYLPFSNLTAGASYQLQISQTGLTYTQYYDEDLNGLFQADINNPNNYILYQEGYFATYGDYTNYVMSTDGPQLTTQATNNATVAYNASWSNTSFMVTTPPANYAVDWSALVDGSLYRLEDTSANTNTSPVIATPGVRLDSANLSPPANYQVQYKPTLAAAWQAWSGGEFTATDVTNRQILPATNGAAFFRLQYVP